MMAINPQYLPIVMGLAMMFFIPRIKKVLKIIEDYEVNVLTLNRIDNNTQNEEHFFEILKEVRVNAEETKTLLNSIRLQIDDNVDVNKINAADINKNISDIKDMNITIVDKHGSLKESINELYNYVDRMNNKISIIFKMIDVNNAVYIDSRNGRKFDNIR